jgi:hypothetical protein
MHRFYKVAITKWPIGTAIQHREPAVQGEVIIKVTDSTTAGDYKLFVVDASDEQHEANLALPAVEMLSEAQATELARKYQPERTLTQFNPLTRKEEEITVPTCDLKKFYQKPE